MPVHPSSPASTGFQGTHKRGLAAWIAAAGLLGLGASLAGCPAGKCFVRLQSNVNGKQSDECLVDTCPANASFENSKNACFCKAGFVPLAGACVTMADANASCGKAYSYNNGSCVAKTCAAGQQLNAGTGACENKAESDKAVAQNAGIVLQQGQGIGCPAGFTYVVNEAKEGACVPNELTCGTGTKYEGGKCVDVGCAAGTVFDAKTGQCMKLKEGETISVQAKLNAAMGPDFCAPHAKNPGGFKVAPGGTQTIKVSVTVNVPSKDVDKTEVVAIKTTNTGGAELTPQVFPGVANVQKQVNEQIIPSIRALGGKSNEGQATAEVTCVIKRAPVQVIETHGGGM